MNMSRAMIMGSVVAGLCAGAAWAGRPGQAKTFSIGLALGAPSGVTAKYWLNRSNAIVGAIGGLGYRGVVMQADYVWHHHDIVKSATPGTTALYFGPGAFLASGGYRDRTSAVLGVRGVGGFAYAFPKNPFELFIEVAPNLVFGGGIGFGFQGALGGRYLF